MEDFGGYYGRIEDCRIAFDLVKMSTLPMLSGVSTTSGHHNQLLI